MWRLLTQDAEQLMNYTQAAVEQSQLSRLMRSQAKALSNARSEPKNVRQIAPHLLIQAAFRASSLTAYVSPNVLLVARFSVPILLSESAKLAMSRVSLARLLTEGVSSGSRESTDPRAQQLPNPRGPVALSSRDVWARAASNFQRTDSAQGIQHQNLMSRVLLASGEVGT